MKLNGPLDGGGNLHLIVWFHNSVFLDQPQILFVTYKKGTRYMLVIVV